MTYADNGSQEQATQNANLSNKEMNFRRQQQMYEKMIAEREARINEMEQRLHARAVPEEEEEDDQEQYVDKKKLEKKLQKFGQKTKQETQSEIQRAVADALAKKEQQDYIRNNPDFFDVLENHAETFLQKAPKLAEAILRMPEGFERQQLVYNNIKALNLDKPAPREPSPQELVDQKRKAPYYQPTNVGTAPYNVNKGDYSPAGQKSAYDQMKALQKQLRL